MASPCVLVVDDNPAIHADFDRALARPLPHDAELSALGADLFGEPSDMPADHLTYEVIHVERGEAAVPAVRAAGAAGKHCVLAFVDMRMPGWDGLATAEALIADFPRLPVVICSAYSDHAPAEIQQRLADAEAVRLLAKPFDVDTVRGLVAEVCP